MHSEALVALFDGWWGKSYLERRGDWASEIHHVPSVGFFTTSLACAVEIEKREIGGPRHAFPAGQVTLF